MGARVLVVGSGGREHALCWRLRQEGCDVHVAPGNDGMDGDATRHDVSVGDAAGLSALATSLAVDWTIVGPEQPLVEGLADALRAAGVATVGPSAAAAALEGSKAEAKAFMAAHSIPTAQHVTVDTLEGGLAALREFSEPPVIKADGLAAGKGVTVAETWPEAEAAVRACLSGGKFGSAGARVVLEERMRGQEASLFVISDGEHAATMLAAQDHKRIGEGDTGPNTGGMGAYAPAPIYSPAVHEQCMERVVRPTLAGLAAQGRPFAGILFVGLMIEASGAARVVEYNCRFGDPEVQPLVFGLDGSLSEVLGAAASGGLQDVQLRGCPAATVVLASAGYPVSSRKGDVITGLAAASARPDVQLFHAGTRRNAAGEFETAGGRVLGVCARGTSLAEALRRAYAAADDIDFDGKQMRRDIGCHAGATAPGGEHAEPESVV